jgi:hypothetical protein
MQEHNLQYNWGKDTVNVELPGSLWSTFDLLVRRQGLTTDSALVQLIDAVPGLSKTDLSALKEPRKERIKRNLTIRIGHKRKITIERFAAECGSSASSVLRRLLYAFFVTKEIAFFGTSDGAAMQLQRTQLRFDFDAQYGRQPGVSSSSEQDNPPEPF